MEINFNLACRLFPLYVVPLICCNWPTYLWSRLHIEYLSPFLGYMWLLTVQMDAWKCLKYHLPPLVLM